MRVCCCEAVIYVNLKICLFQHVSQHFRNILEPPNRCRLHPLPCFYDALPPSSPQWPDWSNSTSDTKLGWKVTADVIAWQVKSRWFRTASGIRSQLSKRTFCWVSYCLLFCTLSYLYVPKLFFFFFCNLSLFINRVFLAQVFPSVSVQEDFDALKHTHSLSLIILYRSHDLKKKIIIIK